MIHEMLSGATLFDNKAPYVIQVAHVEQPPTPLCEIRPDSPAVLDLRRAIAAAWALGGESRRARAELESLAEAYRRLEGRHSAAAWEVRAISARCQMELGDIDGGLTALRAVLSEVVSADGDSSELALDLRRDLAELLGGTGDYPAALEILEPLHADLCVLRGPEDPFTEEVRAMRDELLAADEG